MANTRWEVWTTARRFSDKELVFEYIKGKHLYHTSSGNNYMLNSQREEKIQVNVTPFLYKESKPSDLKPPRSTFLYK